MALPLVVVMGVSGVGKTTVARLLATRLQCPFEDADNLHEQAQIEKMRGGLPLDDSDRQGWLKRIAQQIDRWQHAGQGGVIVCSALKRRYRAIISGDRRDVIFVYLRGDPATIAARLAARQGHFMPGALLASQFDTLEEPTPDERAIWVEAIDKPDEIIAAILAQLGTDRMKQIATTRADTPAALAQALANWFVSTLDTKPGRIAVAAAGGSTPKAFYQCLAAPPYRARVPWDRIHWFFGDERFVPPTDPANNARMFAEAIAADQLIPPGHLHAMPTTEANVTQAAARYEDDLKTFYGADRLDPQRPFFDVTLLGLGTDGHTASLFPGDGALDEHDKWVAPSTAADGSTRLTLTYPLLDSSANVAFLVAGAEKKSILKRFLADEPALPAARLGPVGSLRLFTDRAADPG